jgi:hypothetical protein
VEEGVRDFGNSESLLRFVQEKSDDITKAVIHCTDLLRMTLPDGRVIGPISTKNIGMVLYMIGDQGEQPVLVGKPDATVILNDGILNRMRIKIDVI